MYTSKLFMLCELLKSRWEFLESWRRVWSLQRLSSVYNCHWRTNQNGQRIPPSWYDSIFFPLYKLLIFLNLHAWLVIRFWCHDALCCGCIHGWKHTHPLKWVLIPFISSSFRYSLFQIFCFLNSWLY